MLCPHCGKDTTTTPSNLTTCLPAMGAAQPTITNLCNPVAPGCNPTVAVTAGAQVIVIKAGAVINAGIGPSICFGGLPGNNPTYTTF